MIIGEYIIMKKILIFSLPIVVLISCDLPQRTPNINELSGSSVQTTTNPINLPESTTGTSGNTQPGFETCSTDFNYNGQQIGRFSFCRHSSNASQFQVIFEQASNTGTCFVPTHRLNNGTSFKLGRAECVYNQANVPYRMTLNKELMPPNFSSQRPEPINAVMVLRADAANAYMACMNAKNSYLVSARQIPGNYSSPPCCYNPVSVEGNPHCLQVNPSCEQAANTYANGVCQNFTQSYAGRYKEVILY